MQQIAASRRRFDSRRVDVLPGRKDMVMNTTKLYRIYRQFALSVRQRRGRKRAREIRSPTTFGRDSASRRFVSHAFGASHWFRILAAQLTKLGLREIRYGSDIRLSGTTIKTLPAANLALRKAPAEALLALVQPEGSAPGPLAPHETDNYHAKGLSS